MKNIFEIFKISMPHLTDLQKIRVCNPVGRRGVKIHKERKGMFYSKDKKIYEGTYYVYNTKRVPNKYMCVFIPNMIGEGEAEYHAIALTSSLTNALSKMAYRINVASKKANE